MRSVILCVLLTLFVSASSYAGTIVRGTKSAGGTDFSTGVIYPGEVNIDFNTLYNWANGNVDSANITDGSVTGTDILDGTVASADITNGTIINADVAAAGVADISPAKLDQSAAGLDADIVDDYSTNDAEQVTDSSPGTSDALTNATNLQEELAQIRYKLHELTVGISASAVAASGATAAYTSWADGPIRGPNLLYNGGFDLWSSSTPDAGDGWSVTASPADTVQSENLVEAEEHGDGIGINVIAGAADTNEGIQQALDGLKAATRYLAIVEVRDDVGTCSLGTSGADTNELTVTSDDTGDWQVLAGTFETDAVPSDVTIQLLAVGNSNDCVFEDAGVFEINADPVSFGGPVGKFDSDNTVGDVPNAYTAVPNLSVAWTPPSPGWVVQSGYTVNVEEAVAGGAMFVECRLDESGSNINTTRSIFGSDSGGGGYGKGTISAVYVHTNPTPGTILTYTVECRDSTYGFEAQYNDQSDAGGSDAYSSVWLMAYPPR